MIVYDFYVHLINFGLNCHLISLDQLRNEVSQEDVQSKEKFAHQSQKDSKIGFGGKFGIQTDRVDKSAVGFDYHEKVDKHQSQKDYSTGFGGKFGVQKDRVDKSAVGWEHHEKVEKHSSQLDGSKGFGGKFGVQKDRVDKSALGWEHHEKVDKHESQKDYSVGFGGKFGVQKDRVDKSAVGWDHHETVEKHSSQLDASKGFGLENDRKDSCAKRWENRDNDDNNNTNKPKKEIIKGDAKSLASKFESLAKQDETAAREKIQRERQKRIEQEAHEKELNKDRVVFESEAREDEETCDQSRESNDQDDDVDEVERPLHQQKGRHHKIGISVLPMPKSPTKIIPSQTITSPIQSEPEIISDQQPIEIQTPVVETNPVEQKLTTDLKTVETTNNEDLGLTAIALFDYEAAESDEITFDPDELITNIEMIDEGWWRGQCRGKVGLFPANYVKLNE